MPSWSMTRHLIISMIGIIGGLWLAGVVYVGFAVIHEIDEVFDSALAEIAERLLPIAVHDVRDLKQYPGHHRLDDLTTGPHKEYINYQIRDADGRVLLRSHDAPDEPYPVPLVPGFSRHEDRLYFTQISPEKDVVVQVAEVPRARAEAMSAVWFGLLIPLLAILPLAAFAIRETIRRGMRPIGEFRAELHARDGSNLTPLTAAGLPDEFRAMVEDVNRLLERLSSALDAERTFAASSAHELRNPIAAAQAQARLLVHDASTPEQKRRAEGLDFSLGRLSRKLETLLQLARAEAGVAFSRDDVRLDELVALIVGEFARKPSTRDLLRFKSHGPISIKGDPDALGIAIQNLIDNALKHRTADTEVHVTFGPGPKLTVLNESPVISADELSKLKERFQRGRMGAQNGSGLGLYIADVIARQSGGHLDISSPAKGLTSGFQVTLDLSQD